MSDTIAIGSQSFAVFQTESSWGTVGSPPDYMIPVTDYSVPLDKESRDAKPYCGVLQSKTTDHAHATPQGQITTPLHGFFPAGQTVSFAEYLLRWAFDAPETLDRASKRIIFNEQGAGGTQKRHTGLRVNQATLTGHADGFLELSLDVIGKDEATDATVFTLPTDRKRHLEFLFADVTFALGGSNFPIEKFTWQIQYGMRPKYNGYAPAVLRPSHVQQTLTIQPLKASSTWEVNHRSQTTTYTTGVLTIQGIHGGSGASGTYAKGEVTFNRLALVKSEDTVPPDDAILNPLSFRCLKPNSSSTSANQVWSLV